MSLVLPAPPCLALSLPSHPTSTTAHPHPHHSPYPRTFPPHTYTAADMRRLAALRAAADGVYAAVGTAASTLLSRHLASLKDVGGQLGGVQATLDAK